MEFLDQLAQKVNEATDAAAKEVDREASIAKLRYKNAMRRSEMNSKYTEIGRMHYDELRAHADHTEAVTSLCDEIDALNTAIADAECEIGLLRGGKRCAACGTVSAKNALFCQKCGTKL